MISKELKQEIIQKSARSANDTGSCHVQIALITARIEDISVHLKSFKKDHHSRLGLLKLVGQRKRLTKYLQRKGSASAAK
jgi:small subunit ribosomal protein S15